MRKYEWLNAKGGKMVATITAAKKDVVAYADGWNVKTGEEIETNVVVTMDGVKIASGNISTVLDQKAKNMGAVAKLERVLFTKEVYEAINELLQAEIKSLDVVETSEEEEAEAKVIIEMAKEQVENIEDLPTQSEIDRWVAKYKNDFYEGGDGYIPQKISKERYEWALKILG